MRKSVGVVTRYYKHASALALLDHVQASRNGFTRSINVVRADCSKDNVQYIYQGEESPIGALNKLIDRHTRAKGKKPRSDFNMLFEHIIVFSEEHYTFLEGKYGKEKTTRAMLNLLKKYTEKIQAEFGFEPISISLHLDEGHEEEVLVGQELKRRFIRNIHAHVEFYNFSFSKNVAPLRHLMKKGRDDNQRTNQLNPNFVSMQDIAADIFKSAGFERGISKNVTDKKHMSKELFVKNKLRAHEQQLVSVESTLSDLNKLTAQQYSLIQEKGIILESLSSTIDVKQQELSKLNSLIEQLRRRVYELGKEQLKRLVTVFKPAHKPQRSEIRPKP